MKIVFLVFHGFSDTNGISKKIFYQVDGLRANGHEVDLCYYTVREDGHRIRMINDKVLQDYGCGTIAQIKKRIDYHSLYQYILQNKVEFVYVRSFHNANPWTINLFKKLRKKLQTI
ncbi:MAG: glycosyltransferase family 1 protein, partial [Bacteroides sp.]